MKQFDVAPIGSDVAIGTLLATWEDGTREWLDNLEEPSSEAMVWQPFPNGPSVGGIMLHMACCDLYWIKNFAWGAELDAEHPAVAYVLNSTKTTSSGLRLPISLLLGIWRF